MSAVKTQTSHPYPKPWNWDSRELLISFARGLALFGLGQESELDKKLRGNSKAKQFKRHVILNIEMLARIESIQVVSKSFEH